MENNNNSRYRPEDDENQGVLTTMARNTQKDDTELVGSRVGRMDPTIVTNQNGASPQDEEENVADVPDDEDVADDEPVDRDGDPTGEHDHHQDDNYSLGGNTARTSGS